MVGNFTDGHWGISLLLLLGHPLGGSECHILRTLRQHMERPISWGTKASWQEPCECTILKECLPAPVKPSDECSLCWHSACSLMRDWARPPPEAKPRLLTLRKWDNKFCYIQLLSLGGNLLCSNRKPTGVLFLIRYQSVCSFTVISSNLRHHHAYMSVYAHRSVSLNPLKFVSIFDVCMSMFCELKKHLGGFLCTVLLQIHKTCLGMVLV